MPGDAGTRLRLAQAQHPQATLRTWIAASPATHLFTLQEASYAGLDFFFFLKKNNNLLCFNLTMSNSFLPLSSGLEKDSIISTVARRLLPGHKILIRNNHAALKWELQAAKSQIINKIFNGRNVLLTQPLEQIKAGRQRAAAGGEPHPLKHRARR